MTENKAPIKIEITDYYVMLGLHRALLEAKFHQNPDNVEVSLSPIIADFCNELADNLTKMDGRWDNWRKLENQSFYRERAVSNALRDNRWSKMSREEKVKITKNILSPFKATEEEIECFIREVDGNIL